MSASIEKELLALRVTEMRRYKEGNAAPFDLASRDRVCALLSDIGEQRIAHQRGLLVQLLHHSAREIVTAAAKALLALGDGLDPATQEHDDVPGTVCALLFVFGPTIAFDRMSAGFATTHPRRWELTKAALYTIFREEMGVNRDSKLPILAHEPRWIALAAAAEREAAALRAQEKGRPTNADRSDRAFRSMLQDLLKLGPRDVVRRARAEVKG